MADRTTTTETTEVQASPTTSAAAPPTVTTTTVVEKKKGGVRRIVMPLLLLAVLIFAGNYGYHRYQFGKNHEDTDDAQIDGNIDPVLPRIAGYVTQVLVNENTHVESGTLLAVLDTSDLGLKAKTATTSIANAEAAVIVARANVATAEVNLNKAEADLARDTKLLAGGALTQQQFDVTKTAVEAARSQVSALRDQVTVAEAAVNQKRVEIEQARLQLSYASILAPASGTVAKKSVEVGQYVQAGQPLMAIAENDGIWVTANFKETQLSDIRVGQPADIVVDAFPDTVFHGHVQSFSPATGAKFALLPPDNATGNYVKVVQRVPVRIVFDRKFDAHSLVKPGMSVTATITTH